MSVEEVSRSSKNLDLYYYFHMKEALNNHRTIFIHANYTLFPWLRTQRQERKIIKRLSQDFSLIMSNINNNFDGYLNSSLTIKACRNFLTAILECSLTHGKYAKVITEVLKSLKIWTYSIENEKSNLKELKSRIKELKMDQNIPNMVAEQFLTSLTIYSAKERSKWEDEADSDQIKSCKLETLIAYWQTATLKLFRETIDIIRQQNELDETFGYVEMWFDFIVYCVALISKRQKDRVVLLGSLSMKTCNVLVECDIVNSASKLCLNKIIFFFKKWSDNKFSYESPFKDGLRRLTEFLGEEDNLTGKLRNVLFYICSYSDQSSDELSHKNEAEILLIIEDFDPDPQLRKLIRAYHEIFLGKYRDGRTCLKIFPNEFQRIMDLNDIWFDLFVSSIDLTLDCNTSGEILFLAIQAMLNILAECQLVDNWLQFMIRRLIFLMTMYDITNFKSEFLYAELLNNLLAFSENEDCLIKIRIKMEKALKILLNEPVNDNDEDKMRLIIGDRSHMEAGEIIVVTYENLFGTTYVTLENRDIDYMLTDLKQFYLSFKRMTEDCKRFSEDDRIQLCIKCYQSCLSLIEMTKEEEKSFFLCDLLKNQMKLCNRAEGTTRYLTFEQVNQLLSTSKDDSLERTIAQDLLETMMKVGEKSLGSDIVNK